MKRGVLSVLHAVTLASFACTGVFAQNSYVNFEGKQTSPLRLSGDGTRLFAVNTPDARLSVFDVSFPSNPRLVAEIPTGVEPVSVNPRTLDEVWVVNEVSDSISVASVSQRIVTDTIYVPDEQADVVFAGGKAFVTAARNNVVVVFDATNHARLASIPLFGENPRALAVSADGTKVYAAFALSGNHTTLIPNGIAPPQPSVTNLLPPPSVSLIVDASNPAWTNVINYTMPDNDVVEIDVSSLAITRYFTNVGTINLGLAVRPDNGDLYVANTDALNLIHFVTNLRGHFVNNRVTQISIGTGSRTFYDLNSGIDYTVLPNLNALTNALAQPTALVFDPSGAFFYVAAFGTDRIGVVDNSGHVLARIEVGNSIGSVADPRHKRGPRGLALNAAAQRLYLLNRISNTISIIDTSSNAVLTEFPTGSYDPTPPAIRNGRGFLYDAKLSGNGTAACAACHIDAEMDLLAWDLGDPTAAMIDVPPGISEHPMKGPMITQNLRGLLGNEPFHWRGDKTNFIDFASTFNTLMGSGTNLSVVDMTAFSNFISTVIFEPNPNQNLDRTYPTNFAGGNAALGLQRFLLHTNGSVVCLGCHAAPPGPGTANLMGAVGGDGSDVTQAFKMPYLRDVYQRLNQNKTAGARSVGGFGLMNDGVQGSLHSFFARGFFDLLAPQDRTNLVAFVQCFDNGTAPVTGYTRTLNSGNVGAAGASNDWALLESQAAATNVDLIGKGTIHGARHGLLYQPATGNYLVDSTNLAPLTKAQIQAAIQAGDTLSLTGVPPGSGRRMGIDRDLDGILDGDAPPPSLQLAQSAGSIVLSWPYGAAGYALQTSGTLLEAPVWSIVDTPLFINGAWNIVTNAPAGSAGYFRLRFQ